MKHLRLPEEIPTPAFRTPSPLAIFRARVQWMFRARRVVDRGAGLYPSFVPAPVAPILDQMNALIDERFGIASCPSCGEKVAVLVDGVCRDCQPEDAA